MRPGSSSRRRHQCSGHLGYRGCGTPRHSLAQSDPATTTRPGINDERLRACGQPNRQSCVNDAATGPLCRVVGATSLPYIRRNRWRYRSCIYRSSEVIAPGSAKRFEDSKTGRCDRARLLIGHFQANYTIPTHAVASDTESSGAAADPIFAPHPPAKRPPARLRARYER